MSRSSSPVFGAPRLLFFIVFGVLAYITLIPLAMLLFSTFSGDPSHLPFEAQTLSLANYVAPFAAAETYQLLWTTLVFAVCATGLGIGLAVAVAWLVERTDIFGRQFIFAVMIAPMAIPGMIYAMAWTQLFNPTNGFINVTLTNAGLDWLTFDIFSLPGIIVVQGIALSSHAYLLVAAPFRMLDPTWEEQSAIAGRGILSTLRRITLPIMTPALLAAAIFFTIVSMETFDIPGTIGLTARIDVLSTKVYWLTHPEGGQLPNYGMASTLALILLAIAFGFILLYRRQTRSARRYVTVTGKAFRAKRISLGAWRWPVFALVCVYLVLASILPIAILIWRSLIPFYAYPSEMALRMVSLKAYHGLLFQEGLGQVVWNTGVMGITASIATVALASITAWLVMHAPVHRRYRGWMNALAFFPQAIPSIVIGLALVFFYLWIPNPIYGTVWIIALAMVTKYIAYSTGTMMAAHIQVSSDLEEASQITGASWFRTYRRIYVPLLAPALFSVSLWVFIHVVRELAVALMLYSPDSIVLSTQVWGLWEGGHVGQASALGVLTIAVLLLLLSVPSLLSATRLVVNRFRDSRVGQPSIAGAVD